MEFSTLEMSIYELKELGCMAPEASGELFEAVALGARVEPEQAISAVATKTKTMLRYDWNRSSSFNGIRSYIAHRMRFKTKQK